MSDRFWSAVTGPAPRDLRARERTAAGAARSATLDGPHADENRITPIGGDFFKDTLPRAEVYLLMHVIHDWDVEHAISILRNVRSFAPPHGRLLLLEVPLPDKPVRETTRPAWPHFLDFSMLAWSGGRVRTKCRNPGCDRS
jgi:O-methyltransferase domain